MLMRYLTSAGVLLSLAVSLAQAQAPAQNPPPGQQQSPAKPQAPVQRLGPNLLRIGNVQIDTAKREVSVAGVVNEVSTLEFLANTKGGAKAYESAFELDTNAINFNLALILIGLDPARSVVPKRKFDPDPPQGDPLQISIEWDENGTRRKLPAEKFVYNKDTKQTITEGPWVYTGSVFSEADNVFFAEIDGTIIGFMHTPSPLIENPRPILGAYGAAILNPTLNLKAGTAITLTVRAISAAK